MDDDKACPRATFTIGNKTFYFIGNQLHEFPSAQMPPYSIPATKAPLFPDAPEMTNEVGRQDNLGSPTKTLRHRRKEYGR